jgi:hypothetical protein
MKRTFLLLSTLMGFVYTEAQGMEMGSPHTPAKERGADTDGGDLGMSADGAGAGAGGAGAAEGIASNVIGDIIGGKKYSLGSVISYNNKTTENPFWKIYISPTTEGISPILNAVVPYLVENRIFFQVRGHINDSADKFITVYADSARQAGEYWAELNRLLSGKESALKLLDYEYGLYNTHYEEKRRASYMPAAQKLKDNGVGSILVDQPFIPVGGMNRGLPPYEYETRLEYLIEDGLYAEAAATVVLGYKSGGLNPHLMEDGQKLGFIQNILAIVMGMKNKYSLNNENIGDFVLRTFLPPSMFTQNISQGDWEHALVCATIASAAAHEFTRSTTLSFKPNSDDYIKRFKLELTTTIKAKNPDGLNGESSYGGLIQAAAGVKFEDLMQGTRSVFNEYWSKLDEKESSNGGKKALANALLPKPQSGAGSGSGGGSSAPSGASPARHMSDVVNAMMGGHNPGSSPGNKPGTPSPQRRTP